MPRRRLQKRLGHAAGTFSLWCPEPTGAARHVAAAHRPERSAPQGQQTALSGGGFLRVRGAGAGIASKILENNWVRPRMLLCRDVEASVFALCWASVGEVSGILS